MSLRRKQKYGMSTVIGETATGHDYPVFFDTHYPIAINKPPVTLITGEPGSGKTFAAMLITAHASVLGKSVFVLDPKGDFLALKYLERSGDLNKIQVWTVFANPETKEIDRDNIGMLDPLRLTDNPKDNVSIALEVIQTLVKVDDSTRGIIIPLIKDAANDPRPSMSKLVLKFLRHQSPLVSALGNELSVAFGLGAARLLEAPTDREVKRIEIEGNTIVASLLGLTFPSPSKDPNSYQFDERISLCIMSMLTRLVMRSMRDMPTTKQKLLVIDEAWAVFNTAHGAALVSEVSLMGRSKNMASLFITQSPKHLAVFNNEDGSGSSIDSTISTRFAFRNSSKADNTMTLRDMGIAVDLSGPMTSLESGVCLMQDCTKNHSFIRIGTSDEWTKAFSTTPEPETKKK